ncbi:hypothetical protein NP233_g933 [Leucocoprinus birnbaumii]|uniref:Uncharacterized protein n=1 Tax=Leucocoprinus birnbaumii TaxID=56174 RepID=A0AAD5YZY0_9AGAR|nr:hypothetical protein NP233_g933 [Leucocoprinus birnbaumii]
MLVWTSLGTLPSSVDPDRIDTVKFSDKDIVKFMQYILSSSKLIVYGALFGISSSRLHIVPIPWTLSEPIEIGTEPLLDDLQPDFWNSYVGQHECDAQVQDQSNTWIQLSADYVLIRNQMLQHSLHYPPYPVNRNVQVFSGEQLELRGNVLVAKIDTWGKVVNIHMSDLPLIAHALRAFFTVVSMDIWEFLSESSLSFSGRCVDPRDIKEHHVEEMSESLMEDTENLYCMGILLGVSCNEPKCVAIPMELCNDEVGEIDDLRPDFWTAVPGQPPICQAQDPSLCWTLLGLGYVLIRNPYLDSPFVPVTPNNHLLSEISNGKLHLHGNILIVKVGRMGVLEPLTVDDVPDVVQAVIVFAEALNNL